MTVQALFPPLHPLHCHTTHCSPLTTRYSQLTTRNSPLNTYHSPLAIRYSPDTTTRYITTYYYLLLTTYHLLLTTYYYLLLTTYHSPLTTYCLPLTTHHLLLTTYCLLLTAYCLLLRTATCCYLLDVEKIRAFNPHVALDDSASPFGMNTELGLAGPVVLHELCSQRCMKNPDCRGFTMQIPDFHCSDFHANYAGVRRSAFCALKGDKVKLRPTTSLSGSGYNECAINFIQW